MTRTHEEALHFCSVCGGRDVTAGSACVVHRLASAAGRLMRASREREERRRKRERPFAVWHYVRSDTHVIDHNGDGCEIKAAGGTARNLAGRLLTPAAVASAKRWLKKARYSSGKVRAIRVNVYRKGAVR